MAMKGLLGNENVADQQIEYGTETKFSDCFTANHHRKTISA